MKIMVKNHLKTISAPKSWPVMRKANKFILKLNPGPHALKDSVTLHFVLSELLHLVKTKKESNYVLHNKEVLVDGRRKKERAFPVGLFDVVSIKDIKKNVRILLDKKGKFYVKEIDEREALLKPCRIIGKKMLNKKIQLNLYDGQNLLVESGDFKVGDTIVLNNSQRGKFEHIGLEKGKIIFLTGGKHKGGIGKIEEIIGNTVVYKISSGEVNETLKEYAFVIGEEKLRITIDGK